MIRAFTSKRRLFTEPARKGIGRNRPSTLLYISDTTWWLPAICFSFFFSLLSWFPGFPTKNLASLFPVRAWRAQFGPHVPGVAEGRGGAHRALRRFRHRDLGGPQREGARGGASGSQPDEVPRAIGAPSWSRFFFGGEGVFLLKWTKPKKSGCPYSNLSTGGPRRIQGSLKQIHVATIHFTHLWLFQHQNKGTPPFTSCNVQVYDVRIPEELLWMVAKSS